MRQFNALYILFIGIQCLFFMDVISGFICDERKPYWTPVKMSSSIVIKGPIASVKDDDGKHHRIIFKHPDLIKAVEGKRRSSYAIQFELRNTTKGMISVTGLKEAKGDYAILDVPCFSMTDGFGVHPRCERSGFGRLVKPDTARFRKPDIDLESLFDSAEDYEHIPGREFVDIHVQYLEEGQVTVTYMVNSLHGDTFTLYEPDVGQLFPVVRFESTGNIKLRDCIDLGEGPAYSHMIQEIVAPTDTPEKPALPYKKLAEIAKQTLKQPHTDIVGEWRFDASDVICEHAYESLLMPKVQASSGLPIKLSLSVLLLKQTDTTYDYMFVYHVVNVIRFIIRHDTTQGTWRPIAPFTSTMMLGPDDLMSYERWLPSFVMFPTAVFTEPEGKQLFIESGMCMYWLKRA